MVIDLGDSMARAVGLCAWLLFEPTNGRLHQHQDLFGPQFVEPRDFPISIPPLDQDPIRFDYPGDYTFVVVAWDQTGKAPLPQEVLVLSRSYRIKAPEQAAQ
jgi:hypothetical protein